MNGALKFRYRTVPYAVVESGRQLIHVNVDDTTVNEKHCIYRTNTLPTRTGVNSNDMQAGKRTGAVRRGGGERCVAAPTARDGVAAALIVCGVLAVARSETSATTASPPAEYARVPVEGVA